MTSREMARPVSWLLFAGVLIIIAGTAAARQPAASSFSPGPVPSRAGSPALSPAAPSPTGVRRGERHGPLGAADGVVPYGTTVFDDQVPGVANLDPSLLAALRRATTDAARDGVDIYVNSGWRSPEYQEQLLRQAVSKYGSVPTAARWVGTPATSAHVAGGAVDVGPADATAWLSEHGARYGLCQIYRNESWHFELRAAAIDHRCPRMYADPTHDPRMQQ